MFYDRYVHLCRSRGVTPSRAAQEAGLSKSTVTKWKNDPDSRPTGNVISKLTAYFGVTVAELLAEQPPREEIDLPAPPAVDSSAFYDRFVGLCRRSGVSPSRAAQEAGLSKSIVTKWKNDPAAIPNSAVLEKLAAYFGVSISELLGEAQDPEAVTREAIKFALFGGAEEITDEMFEEVRTFAAFVRDREAAKRRKD